MVMPFTNVRYFQKLIVVGWSHMVLTFGHLVLTGNTIHSDRNISNAFTVDRVIHYMLTSGCSTLYLLYSYDRSS